MFFGLIVNGNLCKLRYPLETIPWETTTVSMCQILLYLVFWEGIMGLMEIWGN